MYRYHHWLDDSADEKIAAAADRRVCWVSWLSCCCWSVVSFWSSNCVPPHRSRIA